jgi:D-inositol-3-phosphate glycosyltransferase
MNKLRIAMLAYHSDPYGPLGGKKSGGMNVYVRNLSSALAQLGHQVDVYTRAWEARKRESVVESNLRQFQVAAGPFVAETATLINYVDEFAKGILEKGRDYDLVHAHYWLSGLAGLSIRDHLKIPLINSMHTLGLVKERVMRGVQSENDQRILEERRILQASDQVIASTIAEQADLQWLYEVQGSKVSQVQPGVDLSLFKPIEMNAARRNLNLNSDDRNLLFVGRIDPIKGLDVLISALSKMKNKDARLIVIGGENSEPDENKNSLAKELLNQSKSLDVVNRVIFAGSKSQEELVNYYNACDAVILPSHHETFGLVALEAMACRRPVIASRVGGLADFVSENETGLLANANDASDLAAKIDELLENETLREEMAAKAHEFANSSSWNDCAVEMASIYKRVVQDY